MTKKSRCDTILDVKICVGAVCVNQVFAVTSGKGGVGKSTVSVGLALSFCKSGKKVLLVDMDEGLRCLDLMLGVDKSAVFDLSDILMGREIEEAAYPIDGVDRLELIPAPLETGRVDLYSFTRFVGSVLESKKYDDIIFDFPAGVDFTLYSALPENSLFLTVAVPDPVSVRDAAAVRERLEKISCKSRLIINCFKYKLTKRGLFKNIDDIIDSSGLKLIGIIPYDRELELLSVKHYRAFNGKSAAAFSRVARRLSGEHILLPKPRKI